jgi:hypothetical protein
MTNRAATTVFIIMSLAATSAPTASAMPAGPGRFVPTSQQSPAAVYSRPDRQMIPLSPPATSSGAIGRAAGLRSLAQQERQRVVAIHDLSDKQLAARLGAAPRVANETNASQTVVRANAPQSGFDWGDAGIGAAGVALSVIGIGGAFAVSQRRSRRTTGAPELTL